MKRLLSFILALLLSLALAAPALADIVVVPEDSFLRSHLDECVIEDRNYYANGAEGYITVYERPGGRTRGELPADENFVDSLADLIPRADTATIVAAARASRTPSPYLLAGAGGAIVIAAAICAAAVKRKRKNL